MKKMIIKKLISFSLVIAMLFTLGVQVGAANISAAEYEGTHIEIDGIVYYVTEEYDENGIKTVTVTDGEETVSVTTDGETFLIETRENVFSIAIQQLGDITLFSSEELQPMMIMSSGTTAYNSARGYSYSITNGYGTYIIPGASPRYVSGSTSSTDGFVSSVNDIAFYQNVSIITLGAAGFGIIVGLITINMTAVTIAALLTTLGLEVGAATALFNMKQSEKMAEYYFQYLY